MIGINRPNCVSCGDRPRVEGLNEFGCSKPNEETTVGTFAGQSNGVGLEELAVVSQTSSPAAVSQTLAESDEGRTVPWVVWL